MQSEEHDLEQHLTSKKHKALYNDCLELYQNTVFHLNRTIECMHANRSCSPVDVQTWLSTAHTNIQTCPTAALELNVVDFKVSKLSNNVTEMISNSLAINMDILKTNASNHNTAKPKGEVFPSWLSSHDRNLLKPNSTIEADLVVARDGSGDFKKIQDAINEAAKRETKKRFVIHVKEGTYEEHIKVGLKNERIMLVGDGLKMTIIRGSRSFKDGFSIYSSPTAGKSHSIDGSHFIARDISFENVSGPSKGQAVALRSSSDKSIFYRCSISGYQDTLFVHNQRQFYIESYIYGTVDFIFGDAAVLFRNCIIYARKPLWGQENVITAQGRDNENKNSGISIQISQIKAAPDLKKVGHKVKTYLGRPWQKYARVAVLYSFLGTLVEPKGWLTWNNSDFALDTLYFGEYRNYGPGSSICDRVTWKTFHVITDSDEARQFTADVLLA
ncbi:putative pectinesterase [Lupinus albus]|uniref:Pectinesterase n=1 Tax=Lupinus albus TaxID=3870 RepID=A0A6A4QK05_LUPAL|nr:putative pectinesterase [Lupinus albus]